MRRPFIAGNWKLNKTLAESTALAQTLAAQLTDIDDCDVVVAPVYTALHSVTQALANSAIAVAAQDIYFQHSGAFTGAVSAPFVKDAGCTYTLVGHSERRQLFGETLATSQRRVQAALTAGITPIFCVGESLEERDAGKTNDIVTAQLEACLQGYGDDDDLGQLVVAYEPVWAIGTGKVASVDAAQSVHATLRAWIAHHDEAAAEAVRIVYGGSVKADNAAELLQQPDIDGALVGGASLVPQSFADIVAARHRGD
jgi:triosephosphate isomerase